ncbi:MAG: COP23 domain-containing protein [Pseudanabaena sp. ELA645]|jgi:hypothetical protein
MSKTIKTLATLLGISVFCLISPMSMLAQTKIQSPDFEDPPEAPISTQLTDPNEPPISTTEPTDSNVTVSCVNDDSTNNIPTTIVEKGTKDTPDYQRAVLISWKTRELGGNFTPKQRCNVVSGRFQAAIQANGGNFKGLLLTNGPVNGRMVICALRPGEEECTAENLLFTLKKENANKAGSILGRLLNVSVTGSGSAIEENSGQQIKVDLGALASRNLRRAGASNVNKTTPFNRNRPR